MPRSGATATAVAAVIAAAVPGAGVTVTHSSVMKIPKFFSSKKLVSSNDMPV